MSQAIRETQNFLSAVGINVAVPINKDPNRALVMRNWRPDRLTGRLRSRLGVGTAIDTFPDPVHTIWLNSGSTRYIGAGTVLYRSSSASSIVTGLDGRKLFLTSADGFVWIMNRNEQKKDDGSTVTDWWIAPPATAPTVATGGAGVLNSTVPIIYAVSYANAAGHESSIGPFSTAVTFSNQEADLTSIPTGPSGTTTRYIYRVGGGLENLYRVGTIADNTTTTFTDNETNDEVLTRGILGATNRDEPPAARGVVHYMARMIAWNTAAYPNRIYWTDARKYWYFPEENYQPIGDFGEHIFACTEINGSLYVIKERSIWRVVGEPSRGNIENVTSEIGLPSELAIVIGRSVVPYLSRKGIYAFNSDRPLKLSGFLEPLYNGEGVATGSGDAAQAINLQALGAAVLEVSDGKLYASIPGSVATSPSETHVYDLDTGEVIQDSRGFTAMTQEGVSGEFVVAIGEDLFSMDNGQTDAGSDIDVTYQSSFIEFGFPDNDKQVFELKIEHTLGSETIGIKVLYDMDLVTTPTVITSSLTGNGITRFPLNSGNKEKGIMCRSMSILIEGAVNAEIEISQLAVTYFVHPRKTQIWMTDVLSQGQTSMWEARQIQAEFDAGTSNVSVKLLADGLSGGDLATVETLTYTVSGDPGRRSIPVMLAAIQPGRLFQVGLQSTTEVKGYDTYLEMRRVPVFLDGARSQYHEEKPISLGMEGIQGRIWEFKDFRFSAWASTADATVIFKTDLPGNAMATRKTITITAGTERRTNAYPLDAIEGRQFQPRWTPHSTGQLRVYAASVMARPIGVYLEHDKSDFYQTQPITLGEPWAVHLIRFVRISYRGEGTIELYTDIPAQDPTLAVTLTLPATTTRQQVRIQLPTELKAVVFYPKIKPTASSGKTIIPYEMEIYAKPLGQGATAWRWIPIPIPGVGEEWAKIDLISDAGTEWQWQQLPSGEANAG